MRLNMPSKAMLSTPTLRSTSIKGKTFSANPKRYLANPKRSDEMKGN
jgi:hypothetical protein